MLTRLPPLNAIKAFHAASRHLNFSKAAEELGVTQSAVSKQILLLEDFVGTQLFVRSATGLTLTKEGNSLNDVHRAPRGFGYRPLLLSPRCFWSGGWMLSEKLSLRPI